MLVPPEQFRDNYVYEYTINSGEKYLSFERFTTIPEECAMSLEYKLGDISADNPIIKDFDAQTRTFTFEYSDVLTIFSDDELIYKDYQVEVQALAGFKHLM